MASQVSISFRLSWILGLLLVFLLVNYLEATQSFQFQSSPLFSDEFISRFDNSGIKKLFSLFQSVQCTYKSIPPPQANNLNDKNNELVDQVSYHCNPGSVRIDDWLNHALKTQYQLSLNEPINIVQFLGTHNSFNARADGYGMGDNLIRKVLQFFYRDTDMVLAQQEFSMTDQLNMGVRLLHLDPQWFFGRLTMCHAGNNIEWFNQLVERIKKEFGIKIEFDSNQIGCLPSDRSWESGLKEIAEWIEIHDDQILFLLINDHERWDHGHTDKVILPLLDYFGHLLFTPSIKKQEFKNRWPSTKELLLLKKRVVLLGTDYIMDQTTLPPVLFPLDMITPGFPRNSIGKYLGHPICLDKQSHTDGYDYNFFKDWTMIGGESVIYGPFYNGPEKEGLILPSNIQSLVDCGVKLISMDQVSPLLVSSSIWTWAKYEPKMSSLHKCVYISTEDENSDELYHGTWYSSQCDMKLNYACQNEASPHKWWISSEEVTLSNKKDLSCPEGFMFRAPQLAYYNKELREEMKRRNIKYSWISYQV